MLLAKYLSVLIAGLCAGRAAGAAVRVEKTLSEGSLAADSARSMDEEIPNLERIIF